MHGLVLLPASAFATRLSDCDSQGYDVTIKNGGEERTAHITPLSGVIEEFGPQVTFTLTDKHGQILSRVTSYEHDQEYCIRSGKITIQRISTFGNSIH